MMPSAGYTGRFAPTPSGPLHFGSLVAALASYLDARHNAGRWLVRIDDIDRPRVRAGAVDNILHTLDRFGLHWDGDIVYQSERRSAYTAALDSLRDRGLLYRCDCPRRLIKGRVYPGTCRDKHIPADAPRYAWRVRTTEAAIGVTDTIQGDYYRNLRSECGDFVVRRSDGIIAYHLATVVDDAWQEISHVVRGADLLPSTPQQVYLQQLLQLPTPVYCHFPVAVDAAGRKVAKRQGAVPVVDEHHPGTGLLAALAFLGQQVPEDSDNAEDILRQAAQNWDLAKVPRQMEITVNN
jgi:glutamyl-Q tRNA(Asp) synthetase